MNILFFIFSLFLVSPLFAYNDLPNGTTAEIVCIGDSIVWGDGKGFPEELHKLTGKSVINAGLPSDTSYGTWLRAREWILKTPPKYLIVQCGYNDYRYSYLPQNEMHVDRDDLNGDSKDRYLKHEYSFLERKITISEFADFIDMIWTLGKKKGVKVIFTTISSNPMEPRLELLNGILRAYPGTVEMKLDAKDFVDGVHLSTTGYVDFAKQIKGEIK